MRDAPAPVLARRLGFMLAAALVAAGTSRSGIGWLLLAAQVAIAATGTRLLTRSCRRIREADQRAADRAQAGVWEWQERSGALWWNDTVYATHGLAPGAEQPDFARAAAMIHADDVPVAHAAWVAALEGSGQLHVQFRIVRPDGTIAHGDQLAVPVTDAHAGERRNAPATQRGCSLPGRSPPSALTRC